MPTEDRGAAALPSAFTRRAVGVLVVAHLAAIFVAVTSSSSPNFPAPQLAMRASGPLQPYLQGTFLNSSYRFFAPNPGSPTVLWFRVQCSDRSVRWVDVPGRSGALVRAPYQRRLNLALQVTACLAPAPGADGKKVLAPGGKTLLQSCVRHVAWECSQAAGAGAAVRNVGAYAVQHAVLLPEQVRDGWEPTDLRTYRAAFLGAYSPAGERVDELRPAVVEQTIAYVTAGILEVDVLPRLRRGGGSRDEALAALCLPEPVDRLLVRHPELLEAAPGADLRRRVEALVGEDEGQTRPTTRGAP
jgi:hypothetical protein